MTRRMQLLPFFAALLVGCGSAPPTETEILWDTWGVPHVFAPDVTSASYALGWAQAHAHGDLLLRLYGQARGRAAEYWGPEHLDADRWIRTAGVPERAREWYEAQVPEARAAVDAFARGVVDYAAAHPDHLAPEVRAVLPVRGEDVLAHALRSIHYTFVVNPGDVERAVRLLATPRERRSAVHEEPRTVPGSNAWAIGPSRTAEGNAMLLANPHLPWSGLFTWFEAQVTTPDVDVYGAALVGHPMIAIGFNRRLAWTHTVNTHDGVDFYEIRHADGAGYHFDGRVRPFERAVDTIRVREEDGGTRTVLHETLRTVHGPVVAGSEASGERRSLAMRVVGLDRPHMVGQYWAMARATNLAEFEAAQARLQMPMFTTMYADADGHVLHLFGGLTPHRDRGGWAEWSGVVPGDTSAWLWTAYHAYEELPKAVDPASGWLQNANDPPWTTTFPRVLDPDRYPPYIAPRGMAFRPQRSARMLIDDPELTFDEMVAGKHSTRMALADRLLDDLVAAARERGGAALREAADVLERWDRTADARSRGGVLFRAWVDEVEARARDRSLFATPWDPERPLETPDGLADPVAASEALERAAARVRAAFGALDVAWGEAHRFRMAGVDLPANGGDGGLGIFRVVGYRPGGDGRRIAAGGDSFVAAVEFSDPVRARTLIAYGNASQPGSPHAGDQIELMARKELRTVWRTRAEIEEHLERRETLTPAGGPGR